MATLAFYLNLFLKQNKCAKQSTEHSTELLLIKAKCAIKPNKIKLFVVTGQQYDVCLLTVIVISNDFTYI